MSTESAAYINPRWYAELAEVHRLGKKTKH